MVKKVLASCVKCKRFLGKKCVPALSKLPIERTSVQEAPFANAGMDLFSPMYLKDGSKVWGFLVTCAVFRCVRLDLVDSLSTESFVRALRRFLARNKCKYLYSDCGTNFMGLVNQLDKIDWSRVADFASAQRLTMKQAPPNAPWYGGFFERLVGVVKMSLRKTVGVAALTLDELQTVLVECEAIVNARPLAWYNGEDVRDLQALTPAHFLQESPGTGAPELSILDSQSLNHRVRYLQGVREQLKRRFENEYLSLLAQRKQGKVDEVKVGEIVLVESGEKRQLWPLARVVELFKGKDGVSRVARVKTQRSELIRPLQRLYRLEVEAIDPRAVLDGVVDVPEREKESVVTRVGRLVRVPKVFDL